MAKETNKKENKKDERVTKSDVTKKNKNAFKDFKAELKKVVWPTSKELINSTTAVIVIVLVTSIIVFALDLLFEKLNTNVVDKIRTSVSESFKNDDEDNVNENVQEDVLDVEDENQDIVLDTTDNDEQVSTEVTENITEGDTEENSVPEDELTTEE